MTDINTLQHEMNTFLADQIVLGMKIHNFHWYIKGETFYPVHAELDGFYAAAEERIDVIAERILAIEGKPVGSLKKVMELTSIEELDEKWMKAQEGFKILIPDFEYLNQAAKKIVELAEELEDVGTADYFTATSLELENNLWMFKSYTH